MVNFVKCVLDALLPQRCVACGRFLSNFSDQSLCPRCWAGLGFMAEPLCKKCGKQLGYSSYRNDANINDILNCDDGSGAHISGIHVNNGCRLDLDTQFNYADCSISRDYARDVGTSIADVGMSDSICNICKFQKHKIYYNRIRAALRYDNAFTQSLIKRFKYNDDLKLQRIFVKWLMLYGLDIVHTSEIIIPVPLHKRRLLKRRYNQSAIIGKMLAKNTCKEFLPNAIIKVCNTTSQSKLPMEQRWINVHGVFRFNEAFRKEVYGKRITLIDDVVTTSATVNECAKVLLEEGGASEVNVLALART